MSEVQSPFTRSPAVKWLFAAGLVTIPFDAVKGIAALGELGNELSFPFFAAAVGIALVFSVARGETNFADSLTLRIALAVLTVILASVVVNLPDILAASFRERSGINKFATSLLVIVYGLALSWLAEQVEPKRYTSLIARFICWSALLSICYVGIELLGRTGAFGQLFPTIDALVHSRQADIINPWDGSLNEKVVFGWDQRFRSVSFEPPAFGNYTGFAWPWVWFAASSAGTMRKLRAWTLLGVFTLVIVLAANRTGLLMLIVNVSMIAFLTSVYSGPRTTSEALAAVRLVVPIAIALATIVVGLVAASNYKAIVDGAMLGHGVSNITRLGFQIAALNIFAAYPLFGVGLGQFAFHVAEHLPEWVFRSAEVEPMLTYPLAPWPNVYSMYARLASELGIVGLFGWIALWSGLAWALAARVGRGRLAGMTIATWHYPVIMNCVGVLSSGFTTDTFRTPMLWVALGLGCGMLMRARRGDRRSAQRE